MKSSVLKLCGQRENLTNLQCFLPTSNNCSYQFNSKRGSTYFGGKASLNCRKMQKGEVAFSENTLVCFDVIFALALSVYQTDVNNASGLIP